MSGTSAPSPWDLDDLPPAPQADDPAVPQPLEEPEEPWRAQVPTPQASAPDGLTPAAARVLADLLDPAADRPVTPPGLPDELRSILSSAVHPALEFWPERSLWASKAALFSVERCEAGFLADRQVPRSGISRPIAVGQVAHRAIQISHTHPGLTVEAYVRAAALAQADSDQAFGEYWQLADIAAQSDVLAGAVSKVTAFLDSWPPLLPEWSPRFEDPLQAKVGKLSLSARPDLVMGRPRGDLRQTMLLCDFKTGDLKDEHEREASFYALVSTLRHGVAPYRSCVYSLAAGEWVEGSTDPEGLRGTAAWVGEQVVRMVDVLSERRTAVETTGPGCSWCPAKATCSAFAALER